MRLGLALSGGAARGIAHLGVLKALDELDIKVNIISGVSSGAIAAVFYAAGYKPTETLKLIKELSVFQIMRPALGKIGLMHLEEIERLYEKYLGANRTFEQLRIPVIISATEMNEGVVAYFSSGKIIKPLLATTAAPVFYRPIQYQGKLLNDGGLLNNLPVDPLQGNCDLTIGVHVNPINHNAHITTMRAILERSVQLAINNNVKLRMHLCDLLLEPQELKHYRLLSFRKADELFDIGYRYTLHMEKNIRQTLARKIA